MGRLGQSWGIRRTGEPTTAGATAAAAVAGRTDSHATLTDTDLRTRRFRFGRRHADRLRLRLRLLVNRNRPGSFWERPRDLHGGCGAWTRVLGSTGAFNTQGERGRRVDGPPPPPGFWWA